MQTATEVRLRVAEYERQVAPIIADFRYRANVAFAEWMKLASKRRRKSKGFRRYVRRMKAKQ